MMLRPWSGLSSEPAELLCNPPRESRYIEADDVQTCYLCCSDGEDPHAGLRDSLFGAAGVWNVRRCSRCGLVWLSPRPHREEIPKLYERYYTHSPPAAGDGASKSLTRATRDAALRRVCGYDAGRGPGRLRRLLAEGRGRLGPIRDAATGSVMWLGASRRGRLLDVGCGNGLFLAQMRDLGWEVEGVEPNPVAAHAARSRYRLDITSAPLEEVSLPANTFDAVTASHVIEHVYDPIGFLMQCGRLLRPRWRRRHCHPEQPKPGEPLVPRRMERVGGSSTPFRFLPSDPENMRRAGGASGGGAEDDGEAGPRHMARQSRTEETSHGTWGEGLAGLPSGLVLVSGAPDDPGDPMRRGDPAHGPAVAVKDPVVSIITPPVQPPPPHRALCAERAPADVPVLRDGRRGRASSDGTPDLVRKLAAPTRRSRSSPMPGGMGSRAGQFVQRGP
jgi:SAM-dependent methyltransferase